MTLPIFVVSKGFAPRMHTFNWLNIPCTVVTHYRDNAKDIKKVAPRARILITNSDKLGDSRNMIIEELVKKGQWYMGMDDNIQVFNSVCKQIWNTPHIYMGQEKPPKGYATWRQAYRVPLNLVHTLAAFDILRKEAEKLGTIYGGFASMENPFFRQKKWGHVRFVKSKAFVMKNTGVPFPAYVARCGQDSWYSSYAVANYGCVAVCNYVHPVCRMYEEGGIGKSEPRRVLLNPVLARIVKEYPGLVMLAKGANSALRFRRVTINAVKQWQQEQKECVDHLS